MGEIGLLFFTQNPESRTRLKALLWWTGRLRPGVRRFGSARVPMDEALAQVTVDLSNRPFLHLEVNLPSGGAGLDPQLLKEFWRAVSIHGGMTLHISVPYGENTHHILEAVFKAAGRALDAATQPEPRAQGVPSTKGVL